jgi:hypothetical protein
MTLYGWGSKNRLDRIQSGILARNQEDILLTIDPVLVEEMMVLQVLLPDNLVA